MRTLRMQTAVRTLGPRFGLLVAVVMLLLTRPAFPTGVAAQNADSDYTGAWRVMITPEGGPTFGGLSTYHADGTIDSAILPVVAGPEGVTFNSAGFGVIAVNDDGSATITIVHLRADANGTFIGTFTVRGVITLDESGDHFTGEFQRTVANPAGEVLMVIEGTVEGFRILAEGPLESTPSA